MSDRKNARDLVVGTSYCSYIVWTGAYGACIPANTFRNTKVNRREREYSSRRKNRVEPWNVRGWRREGCSVSVNDRANAPPSHICHSNCF